MREIIVVFEQCSEALYSVHCKKRFASFPSPAGMSLTKLSLDGNKFIIPAGDEKIVNLFLQCRRFLMQNFFQTKTNCEQYRKALATFF
jgi:hypothetical protein